MDLNLDGKIAVVTGASRGIGKAIVSALANEGATVVASARSFPSDYGKDQEKGRIVTVEVDLLHEGAAEKIIQRAAELGGLDILVNNVGAVTPRMDGFLAIPEKAFDETYSVNFKTALRTIRAALPLLLERGAGSVISISSVNAFLPDPGVADYSVAKAALTNLSKALSKEFGPRGIRFNTISPGPVATDMWFGDDGIVNTISSATGLEAEVAKKSVVDAQGGFTTGRFTEASEVAALAAMLSGAIVANVNGSDFLIDGGLIKTL
ncbi:SDR family NAD(P)-dependent oxidoreductase [Arthrobacter sp. SLBN-112]|uniref:SDR family NAD(P)-dependent oxidoreductase n=1 Tax=Arthrobacter sp. SLBN-112 TaxID=2768452 RepID=UPI0027B47B52|nr:SDR family NAD(P)-dependent oxidoreductase [Arthrobacter sp. SLBN-112]MDQ0799029.1 NAD(P)-dependent dehydrogenase (short-subunit alcohol dehydrogenase family) [Arthrobacter sp. SLBN-112]